MNPPLYKVLICAGFALIAFAGNSVLCRVALGDGTIDAASFTVIRLIAGALVLALLILFNGVRTAPSKGGWFASFMLFVYAATFSFAYLSLDTGVGALILFGSVQITMIVFNVMSGGSLNHWEKVGVLVAFSGFVYLVKPSLTSPPLFGFLLMTLSGIAWGAYTLCGRTSLSPLHDTAFNFIRTLPFVILLFLFSFHQANFSNLGVLLAVASGAITSGLGYAIWYVALRGLSVTQAAVIQLLVPVIAALGGVLFANEKVTLQLLISSVMVLGGIFLVVFGKQRKTI